MVINGAMKVVERKLEATHKCWTGLGGAGVIRRSVVTLATHINEFVGRTYEGALRHLLSQQKTVVSVSLTCIIVILIIITNISPAPERGLFISAFALQWIADMHTGFSISVTLTDKRYRKWMDGRMDGWENSLFSKHCARHITLAI